MKDCPFCGKRRKPYRITCGHPVCVRRNRAEATAEGRMKRLADEARAKQAVGSGRRSVLAEMERAIGTGTPYADAVTQVSQATGETAAAVMSVWRSKPS